MNRCLQVLFANQRLHQWWIHYSQGSGICAMLMFCTLCLCSLFYIYAIPWYAGMKNSSSKDIIFYYLCQIKSLIYIYDYFKHVICVNFNLNMLDHVRMEVILLFKFITSYPYCSEYLCKLKIICLFSYGLCMLFEVNINQPDVLVLT